MKTINKTKIEWISFNAVIDNNENPNPSDYNASAIQGKIIAEGYDLSHPLVVVELEDTYMIVQGHNRKSALVNIATACPSAYKKIVGGEGLPCVVITESQYEAHKVELIFDNIADKTFSDYMALQYIAEICKETTTPTVRAQRASKAYLHILSPSVKTEFQKSVASINSGDLNDDVKKAVAGNIKGWNQYAEACFIGSARLKAYLWNASYPTDTASPFKTRLSSLSRQDCIKLAKAYAEDENQEGEKFCALWDSLDVNKEKKFSPKFVPFAKAQEFIALVTDNELRETLNLLFLTSEGADAETQLQELLTVFNSSSQVEAEAESIQTQVNSIELTEEEQDALSSL